ncbi:male-specific lethal 1 homolog [Egretta garzetta]|uniref:male-specific lethal 1 homolog n=1 Tax=Egretta garzetta TaxID=188379 RepID=UPI00163D26FF|nr:male-specific lethal 1 homolog [Egretta garzetta]
MERRVQLVKKDSEREKHRIFQGFEVDEKPEAEACEKLPLGWPPELKPTFGSAERKTPVKKLVSEFSKVKSKTPKHSPGKEESGGSLSETVCKRELRSQETPEKPRSLLETPLRTSAPPKGPGAHPKEKGFFSSETDDLPYLSTTEMYLCRWHQPPPPPLPLREPSPKKGESGLRRSLPLWHQRHLIPSSGVNSTVNPGCGWRAGLGVKDQALHTTGALAAGSGPCRGREDALIPRLSLQNLDDSVFSKRHAKLELDEKRRKRWDIQRIREQRILQRLQLRMYKRKGIQESEPEVTSFFPEPDDVESLLITPYLPVVAFGRPLPKLTPQNFELPWLDERSRCRLEVQKKQTPHRTCRK